MWDDVPLQKSAWSLSGTAEQISEQKLTSRVFLIQFSTAPQSSIPIVDNSASLNRDALSRLIIATAAGQWASLSKRAKIVRRGGQDWISPAF